MNSPAARTVLSILLMFVLGACTAPHSFIRMGHPEAAANGRVDPLAKPQLSDTLALNYADAAATLLRAKYQGARIARQTSDITQLGLAAATGASAAFGYPARTIAWLGVGSVVVPELQRIIDAKGRAQAYQDAVRLIEEAELEFLSFNQDPSEEYLTQNGVTLLQRVTATIHLVEKTLTGQLPSIEDLNKATEPMSARGALRTAPGATPLNNIPANPAAYRLPKKTPTAERARVPEPFPEGRLTSSGEKILETLGRQVVTMRKENDGQRASRILKQRGFKSSEAEAVELLADKLLSIETDAQARRWKTVFDAVAASANGQDEQGSAGGGTLGKKEGTVDLGKIPPPPPGGTSTLPKTPGVELRAVPPPPPGAR